MGYRFQKITSTDYSYLQPFLALNPHYKQLSYRELYELYVERCAGWHNNFGPHLSKLGYETQEICFNFQYLQELWAKEHAIQYSNENWLKEIVAAQVRSFKPEIILLDDIYVADRSFRQFLREICPTPVKLLAWHASPTADYKVLRDLDVVLTCTHSFVKQMRAHGANAKLMMHAFEPSILSLIPTAERTLDFTFMGSLILEEGFHNQRFQLVNRLIEKTCLQVWGRLTESRKTSRGRAFSSRLFNRGTRFLRERDASDRLLAKVLEWDQRLGRGPLVKDALRKNRDRFHPPVIALEYFELLAKSKINLNNHIDCAEEYAGNIRLFEATGMGACLVTDWKINLPEIFESDTEIVTYKNDEECVEKVNYLLSHQNELVAIADAGRRRTLRDHTYINRAQQLDEILKELRSDH